MIKNEKNNSESCVSPILFYKELLDLWWTSSLCYLTSLGITAFMKNALDNFVKTLHRFYADFSVMNPGTFAQVENDNECRNRNPSTFSRLTERWKEKLCFVQPVFSYGLFLLRFGRGKTTKEVLFSMIYFGLHFQQTCKMFVVVIIFFLKK